MIRRSQSLDDTLATLPSEPGVYLMKDAESEILYVGKASSLRSRVRSYFQSARHLDPKTQRLVPQIADVETIVTASEREALILEDTLIKRHKPPFNVRLRDDKRYPYLKLTAEAFPRLVITRELGTDAKRGARYFGPYTNAHSLREARKTLQKVFRIRTCSLDIGDEPVRDRPCLDHYLGLCDAPCVQAIDRATYVEQADEAALFLEGRHDDLFQSLRADMRSASEALNFERAAGLRDRLQSLQRLVKARKVVDPKGGDRDAVALAQRDGACSVQVFFIRDGKLIGRERFNVDVEAETDPSEVLTAFVKQFYRRTTTVPPEILVQHDLDEPRTIEEWLGERRGRRVKVKRPQRGPKARLIETVARNAELALSESPGSTQRPRRPRTPATEASAAEASPHETFPSPLKGEGQGEGGGTDRGPAAFTSPSSQPSPAGGEGVPPMEREDTRRGISSTPDALVELRDRLGLDEGPSRIEGYDVSNIHGLDSVVAMVVFENGRPNKRAYRHFSIRRSEGPDDYAMLSEAVRRRLRRAIDGDEAFLPLPDLVLIDGGKGQLSAVRWEMKRLGFESIPTLALAKEHEDLFQEGHPDALDWPPHDPTLQLLQRVRDEAHRFALDRHRRRRDGRTLQSGLHEIPGVGPARTRTLLAHFGSVRRVAEASLDDLLAVPDLPQPVARRIHQTFHARPPD